MPKSDEKKAACGTDLRVSRRAIGGLAAVPSSFVTGQQIIVTLRDP
jgi:hypothetical protein